VVAVSAAILRRASWRNCCDAAEVEQLFVSMIHNLPWKFFLEEKKGTRDRVRKQVASVNESVMHLLFRTSPTNVGERVCFIFSC
jgi:hypothetical protein